MSSLIILIIVTLMCCKMFFLIWYSSCHNPFSCFLVVGWLTFPLWCWWHLHISNYSLPLSAPLLLAGVRILAYRNCRWGFSNLCYEFVMSLRRSGSGECESYLFDLPKKKSGCTITEGWLFQWKRKKMPKLVFCLYSCKPRLQHKY